MGSYTLSEKADGDILYIAQDSVERWGFERAERYILGLHDTFNLLGRFPEIGRKVDDIRPGYFRIESARHSIFYRKADDGVLIVRVLHSQMDAGKHL